MIGNDENIRPWYKEFYVWMMLFFPMLAVFGCIVTIILAVKSNDGLVVDDYYKKGLEINRTLERDQNALDYQLNADINLDQESEEVEMVLAAASNFKYPENLSVSFLHATRLGFDKEVNMILTNNNIYRGNLTALIPGKWYVHIQRGNWRLIKTININN
jgi:uncharacterized protein